MLMTIDQLRELADEDNNRDTAFANSLDALSDRELDALHVHYTSRYKRRADFWDGRCARLIAATQTRRTTDAA